ncbi:MAG TPA: hypothetical protein VJ123_07235 [Anaerolineales bacterium]|nr:hypothetical protein [Anaerolineales bacterium]
MRRIGWVAMGLILSGLITGCAPVVTVQNTTRIPVRAFVWSGGRSEVLSPSPGESSSAEVSEGPYRVSVVPDQEWIEYAKATRRYLNERLADSDHLTGQQLLDVIRRLKDIAQRIQQFENAAGTGSGCRGKVSSEGGGLATISTSADGSLVVSCK